jgi:endogenous inhibitor of DNA gyrase (YacG/DUF329 family)
MSAKCPTCGRAVPPASEAHPFCSSRCRLVDLGRWLDEEYRIPAVDDDDEPSPEPPTATPPSAAAPPTRLRD